MKKSFFRDPWSWIMLCCVCVAVISICIAVATWSSPTDKTPQEEQSGPYADTIFSQLFAQPDWEMLYEMAGLQDTPFEGGSAFATYMTRKCQDNTLSFREFKSDKEDVRRYVVFCGDEKIAGWTLSAGSQWQIDKLEFFYTREICVTVLVDPESTVFVNGVALGNDYTIETVQTKAENYLPDGIHGYRSKLQRVDGLLLTPVVTATDKSGNEIALVFDEESGIYRQPFTVNQMSEVQEHFVRNAAIADAQFAIDEINAKQLAAYFDAETDLYRMIVKCPHNIQTYIKSVIDESKIEVSQFRQYSDTLFSARVKLTQKITRTYGTIKTYKLDKTYFFTLNEKGEYRVVMATNEDAAREEKCVRLDFVQGQSIDTRIVPADEKFADTPKMSSENFLGWAKRTKLDNGDVVMTVRILPDGTVLGDLEPMMLYPIYQTEK